MYYSFYELDINNNAYSIMNHRKYDRLLKPTLANEISIKT